MTSKMCVSTPYLLIQSLICEEEKNTEYFILENQPREQVCLITFISADQ